MFQEKKGIATATPSGSGGDAVEAIADLLSIARLPPGHDPGAGYRWYGVAMAVRQRLHLAIRPCNLFGSPIAAANDERTCAAGAHERADETARPGHGPRRHLGGSRRITAITPVTADHGRPRRSQRSRPVTAERFGRGFTAPASRTRRARQGSRCAGRP